MRIKFTREEAEGANDKWGFNCGPAALCAVLGKTPRQIRADLCDFEDRGYTNPQLMFRILRGLDVTHFTVLRADEPRENLRWPKFGLVRVQWAGPWTEAGVPIIRRQRHSHWIAVRESTPEGRMVFDVNAVPSASSSQLSTLNTQPSSQGWLTFSVWSTQLVPWLLKHCEPKASGVWWPTHGIEIQR